MAVISTVFGEVEFFLQSGVHLPNLSQPHLRKLRRRSKMFVDVLAIPPVRVETQPFACSFPGDRARQHAKTQRFLRFLPFTHPFDTVLGHKAYQKMVFHALAECHPDLLNISSSH